MIFLCDSYRLVASSKRINFWNVRLWSWRRSSSLDLLPPLVFSTLGLQLSPVWTLWWRGCVKKRQKCSSNAGLLGGCGKSSLPSSSCRMRFCATLRSYRKNSFVCRTSMRKLLSKEFSTSSSDKTFHRYLMKLHLVAKAVWPHQSLKNNCSVALESQNFHLNSFML